MTQEESPGLQKEIRDNSRLGRYIYGIIKANEIKSSASCGSIGTTPGGFQTDEEICMVIHRDIACVFSNSPLQDYSSLLKETLGHLLVKHQTIIEKIMKNHTIIPMKFGTTVCDDDEIVQVLKRGYSQFKELLSQMDGKIELDLIAVWNDLGNIIKEIGEEDEKIKELKQEIAKKPPDKSFQDRIKIGMMIKDALDKRKEKEQTHIIDFLKAVAVDFQKHQVMDDKMILNCAFLLEKNNEPEFDAKLKELDREYKQEVNFRCVGSLPPYSFATCQLRKISYNQIAEAKKLLGLKEEISLDEIKELYRKLAQKNHPDKHPGNNQFKEKFEKITQAYKLLTSCCQGNEMLFDDSKEEDFFAVEIVQP